MSDDYTPDTDEVRESFYVHAYSRDMEHLRAAAFDRWLTAHDADIRTAALEEAATLLRAPIGIQLTDGIGWKPANSLAGAAHYLRHLARISKVDPQ